MRLYIELFKRAFQRTLTYRAATIAGLLTNLFFGLLRAAVMVALYGARPDVGGFSLQAAITFTGVSQAIIAFQNLFGSYEIMESVSSGDIASDLLKPYSYFGMWMARDFGRAVSNLALRSFVLMAAYAVMFHISVPSSVGQWLALLVTLILSWAVSFAWRFLVNLAAFWSPEARGIGRMAFGLALFLSGFLMPLKFFPDWFVTLCNLTPFPAMVNTVVEVYLGVLTGPALLQALLVQAVWLAMLIIVAQLVMRAGVRRLVIQGG
ncbi:MAG TPA: ABC-2 family transporter protein [Anaerolineae bacterium]|jgi:ABC-2 type transport system permease protein